MVDGCVDTPGGRATIGHTLPEWLRRERRRQAAREQLEAAHAAFTMMGAHGLAERFEHELLAVGANSTRQRSYEQGDRLSVQEARIAELASQGMSNVDIAAAMFISRSTVDYHLRKIFRKLGISSRTKLHLVLRERDQPGLPPPRGGERS